MRSASEKGKTLWEMAMDKFRGTPETQAQTPRVQTPEDFFNPLRLSLGGYVKIENGDYTGATFSVETISEITRRGTHKSVIADYSLHDPDTPDPDPEKKDGTWLTLRVIPKDGSTDAFDCALLHPLAELEDSKELEKVLKGTTLKDDETGAEFQKQAGPYDCSVREISADGKQNRLQMKYWDFANADQPKPLYVVELDTSDRVGIIQTYRGELISQHAVKS